MSSERLWILSGKKESGEASPSELEELKSLLAAESASGFSSEVTDKIWNAPIRSIPENDPSAELWQRIVARTGKPSTATLLLSGAAKWKVAASVLIIAAVAAFASFHYRGSNGNSLLAGHKNVNQVSTQPGSRSKLKLPDGTQVWLNGNSRLTYGNGSFGKSNREVLLTGEAFFDVVRNEKVPFIIHTGPVNITVKGTAFNVKAYPREKTIETSLVRGLVEITTEQDPERKIVLRPNEKITIPVDRATVSSVSDTSLTKPYSITKLKISEKEPEEIAWVNDRLIFDDEPLAAIVPKMENWYHIKIHLTNENIKSKRFSGVIENESLQETLDAMQLSYHFTYELKGNDLWIGDK